MLGGSAMKKYSNEEKLVIDDYRFDEETKENELDCFAEAALDSYFDNPENL